MKDYSASSVLVFSIGLVSLIIVGGAAMLLVASIFTGAASWGLYLQVTLIGLVLLLGSIALSAMIDTARNSQEILRIIMQDRTDGEK